MDSFIWICISDKRIHTYSINMEDFMLVRKENKIIRQKGRVVEDAEWDRDEVYSIIMNNEWVKIKHSESI